MWAAQDQQVKFISGANGTPGHYVVGGGEMARSRKKMVGPICEWRGDIVMALRPHVFYPEHRCLGVLVQEAVGHRAFAEKAHRARGSAIANNPFRVTPSPTKTRSKIIP